MSPDIMTKKQVYLLDSIYDILGTSNEVKIQNTASIKQWTQPIYTVFKSDPILEIKELGKIINNNKQCNCQ